MCTLSSYYESQRAKESSSNPSGECKRATYGLLCIHMPVVGLLIFSVADFSAYISALLALPHLSLCAMRQSIPREKKESL